MVQSHNRLIELLLLLYWMVIFFTPSWCNQYSSVGNVSRTYIASEKGLIDLAFALSILSIQYIGDYINENPMAGYRCPVYCQVDHKHLGVIYDKKEQKKTKQQRDVPVFRPTDITGRKSTKITVRPESDDE